MHEFENRLWADLLKDHGADLALARHPVRRRPQRRRPIGLGAIVLVAVAITIAFSLTPQKTSPAYAVTVNSDGTVTVTIRELTGITGANKQLSRLGIHARARAAAAYRRGCKVVPLRHDPAIINIVRPSRRPFAIKINPSAIPSNATLLVSATLRVIAHPRIPIETKTVGKSRLEAADLRASLVRNPVPACALGH
jgi:hypothetical protein